MNTYRRFHIYAYFGKKNWIANVLPLINLVNENMRTVLSLFGQTLFWLDTDYRPYPRSCRSTDAIYFFSTNK